MSGTTEVQSSRWPALCAAGLALLVVAAAGLAVSLVASDEDQPDAPPAEIEVPFRMTYEWKEAGSRFVRVREIAYQDRTHLRVTETVDGRVVREQILDGENAHFRQSGEGWTSRPIAAATPANATIRQAQLIEA